MENPQTYEFDIKHYKGKTDRNADSLPRKEEI